MDISGNGHSGFCISSNGVESPVKRTECVMGASTQGDMGGSPALLVQNVFGGDVVGCPQSPVGHRNWTSLGAADFGISDPGDRSEGQPGHITESPNTGHLSGCEDLTTAHASQDEHGGASDQLNNDAVSQSHSEYKFDDNQKNGLIPCPSKRGPETSLDRTESQLKHQHAVLHPDCYKQGLNKDVKESLGQGGKGTPLVTAVGRGQSASEKNVDSLPEATNAHGVDLKYSRAFVRCISASLKGFLIGAGLRGGFALFSVLVRLKRRASRRSHAGVSLINSNREAVIAALKDTLRYGMFLGTYAGTFCGVDEALSGAFGPRRTAKWRKLVAGAIAGPSLLFTGPGAWHTSMAIYILMRAVVLAARVGIQSTDFGWLFRPLTWSHGDTFLMCLSSSQILWSWIMNPSSLPSSYVAFINKQGGKEAAIIKGIQEIALNQRPLPSLKEIQDHYRHRGSNIELNPYMEIPCSIIHGGQGCIPHSFFYFLQSYLRAIPVYIPVHVVGALLVQRTELFKRQEKQSKAEWHNRDEKLSYSLDLGGEDCHWACEKEVTPTRRTKWDKRMLFLKKISLGIARSSLFLSVYAASAWLWTCGLFRVTRACTPALVAIGTFPTGLALLLEQKSRRMEIALYCLSRAIESFSICVGDSGFLRRYNLKTPKRIDVLLFSLATAIIMQCHSMEDKDGKIIRPKYRNVLNWVFGETQPESADSNQPPNSQPPTSQRP